MQILNEIAQHKIRLYDFPDCDYEEDNKQHKKLKVSQCSSLETQLLAEVSRWLLL